LKRGRKKIGQNLFNVRPTAYVYMICNVVSKGDFAGEYIIHGYEREFGEKPRREAGPKIDGWTNEGGSMILKGWHFFRSNPPCQIHRKFDMHSLLVFSIARHQSYIGEKGTCARDAKQARN
jgi:hypothetical protein